VREKPKYLIRQKEYIIEEDVWEELENLENTMKLVKEFEKEIRKKDIRRVQTRKQKPEIKVFKRRKLLHKYIAEILFG